MRKETLQEKIDRVIAESVEIAEYDPKWIKWFESEKNHLQDSLPPDLIIRIEHFGSTSVKGLVAKPIVDMVIEITDEEWGREIIPTVLEPLGYDCFWRPIGDSDEPPYFTWCIRRNGAGERTHHLHFVTEGVKDAELRFRDILRGNPQVAAEYGKLKLSLSKQYVADRISYTKAKGDFIRKVLNSSLPAG